MKIMLAFSLFLSTLSAEFVEVKQWSEMASYFQEVDETTLVAFDVDHTLVAARDGLFSDPEGEVFLFDFIRNHPSIAKNITDYGSMIYLNLCPSLLDSEVPLVLQAIKTKKSKVIALTAMNTGSYGSISSLQELRYNHLLEIEIQFDDASFPDSHEFPDFGSGYDMPLFHKGILFSAGTPKGKVLLAFLKKVNFTPKKVIFVDDKKAWVQEMETSLTAAGIDNLCIHLRQIEEMGKFDPVIAEFQLNTLLEEKKWISDEEAKRFLSNS